MLIMDPPVAPTPPVIPVPPAPAPLQVSVQNVTVHTVHTQRLKVPFTVRGSYEIVEASSVGPLMYSDDSGAAQPAVALAPLVGEFSFVHPGYATPGERLLYITVGGRVAASNAFKVLP